MEVKSQVTSSFRPFNHRPIVQGFTKIIGFDVLRQPPSVERFSSLLRDTSNEQLEQVHNTLARRLAESNAITPKILVIDSCPVPAPVKENNLKTALRKNRFNKKDPSKGGSSSPPGYYGSLACRRKQKSRLFWGLP